MYASDLFLSGNEWDRETAYSILDGLFARRMRYFIAIFTRSQAVALKVLVQVYGLLADIEIARSMLSYEVARIRTVTDEEPPLTYAYLNQIFNV